MKLLALIKATFSQDMNLFKYSAKKNSSKAAKILLPVFIFGIVCYAIGTLAYSLAEGLAPLHLTHVMLSLFAFIVTMLTFMEGIYKSQGILFDAKDNNLLFALPIKKSNILFIRILKLLVFQYLYNLMFLLPAIVVYAYFERPGVSFYLISLLMTFIIPIIPTVIASALGYMVKMLSSKFKAKKLMQTILSGILFIGVFFVSLNMKGLMQSITENATSINDIVMKIYYPLGLYINLITKFEILDLIKLLAINIIPFLLFILIAAKFYFRIISRSSEVSSVKSKNKKMEFVKRKSIVALARKEIKRYFSSSVYMFNTAVGLFMCVIVSVLLCFKGAEVFNMIANYLGMENKLSITAFFYVFILFMAFSTSITSSSISLEGKTINITKSLPISEKTILKSKILACFVIELPFLLVSDIIFSAKFNPGIWYILLLLVMNVVVIFITACLGLYFNLKYPKMDATSDTEVVKQSMSSSVSVFAGMAVFIVSAAIIYFLSKVICIELAMLGQLAINFVGGIIIYRYLMSKGAKAYRKINV